MDIGISNIYNNVQTPNNPYIHIGLQSTMLKQYLHIWHLPLCFFVILIFMKKTTLTYINIKGSGETSSTFIGLHSCFKEGGLVLVF